MISIQSAREAVLKQITALPAPGTKAAQLTERDKVALAIAAGVPYRIEIDGTTCGSTWRARSALSMMWTEKSSSASVRCRIATWLQVHDC
jgi:hypothetical protein